MTELDGVRNDLKSLLKRSKKLKIRTQASMDVCNKLKYTEQNEEEINLVRIGLEHKLETLEALINHISTSLQTCKTKEEYKSALISTKLLVKRYRSFADDNYLQYLTNKYTNSTEQLCI